MAVFERLAHHFEHLTAEFWKLVEKEDSVVGKADFAGCGIGASANESHWRDGVVR